jgi:hypothetical protein
MCTAGILQARVARRQDTGANSMTDALSTRWFAAFLETVQRHEASTPLRTAALQGRLGQWTEALTRVVVSTCDGVGWKAAAKGHRSDLLPVRREEYLALDVAAFEPAGDRRWRFPIAVFELENSRADDPVAYSLWKVLCVRAALRVVFCYRRDAAEGVTLVRHLTEHVVRPMGIEERSHLGGETLVVVGSRNEAATFPYGFFKEWYLDTNTARFSRA